MDALAWFGALAGFGGIRGFTGQRRRGSAPSAALGRLEDGAPAPRARCAPRAVSATRFERMRSPCVPGMRLWAYLRYALVCTDMNGTLPKWTNSEPGCVLCGFMLG